MKQRDIFGSETHEYLFVIEPDQKTADKLIQFRMLLNNSIPLPEEILRSKPHISLCYFEASDFSDELIITKAQGLTDIENFNITIDGCEKWNNGTFVLKIKQDSRIEMLIGKLATIFKGTVKTPHLTIARSLPKIFLQHLLTDSFQYQGNFNCDTIVLLKKTGNKWYEILHKFPLC